MGAEIVVGGGNGRWKYYWVIGDIGEGVLGCVIIGWWNVIGLWVKSGEVGLGYQEVGDYMPIATLHPHIPLHPNSCQTKP